jgi:hypothetical protein
METAPNQFKPFPQSHPDIQCKYLSLTVLSLIFSLFLDGTGAVDLLMHLD